MAGQPGRSGRKPNTLTRRQTEAALGKLTRKAVVVIENALDEGDKQIAQWVINHSIGTPRQKVEHSGPNGSAIEVNIDAKGTLAARIARLSARKGTGDDTGESDAGAGS